MSWTPICADKFSQFEDLSWKIHLSFGKSDNGFTSKEDTSLMYGKAGLAIYYGYAYKTFNNSEYFTLFSETVNNIIDCLGQNSDPSPNYGRGYAGIGWGLQHLASMELLENEDLLGDFARKQPARAGDVPGIGENSGFLLD